MKKLFLAMLALVCGLTVSAQIEKGYRGFAEVGYSLSLSTITYSNGYEEDISDMIRVTTTHGYQIIPNLFVGGGAGVVYGYQSSKEYGESFGVPVFGDLRFDMGSNRLSYFIDFKAGYSFADIEGLYLNPQVGIRYALTEKLGLNLSLGWDKQNFSDVTGTAQGAAIKLAVDF